METKLIALKENFNKIMDIRNNIQEIFDILHVKILKLQKIHSDLMQACKTQLFVFGLDSFHFQNKIIDIEYADMMRYFLAINNRMYCEYYKLYKIVVEYTRRNTKDNKIAEIAKLDHFPPYKDLEPFKEYKMELLVQLHESLLGLLSSMISYIYHKEHELILHEDKKNSGLNIDNFVSTFNYHISIMKEKTQLFIKYIEFFHILHSKYLQRFSNKIQLMYAHINNDIHLEGNLGETRETRQPTSWAEIVKKNQQHAPSNGSVKSIESGEDASSILTNEFPKQINNMMRLVSESNEEQSAIAIEPPTPQLIVPSEPATPQSELGPQPTPLSTHVLPQIPLPFKRESIPLSKTKSVNDILQQSIYGSMSKSNSSEDIAVYNVFSAIDTKCSSIVPLSQINDTIVRAPALHVDASNILVSDIIDIIGDVDKISIHENTLVPIENIGSTETRDTEPVVEPKKKRGRKKKSDT